MIWSILDDMDSEKLPAGFKHIEDANGIVLEMPKGFNTETGEVVYFDWLPLFDNYVHPCNTNRKFYPAPLRIVCERDHVIVEN